MGFLIRLRDYTICFNKHSWYSEEYWLAIQQTIFNIIDSENLQVKNYRYYEDEYTYSIDICTQYISEETYKRIEKAHRQIRGYNEVVTLKG